METICGTTYNVSMKTKSPPVSAYGLSRMETKSTRGWLVRVPGKKSKFFSDRKIGGKLKARKAAVQFRNLLLLELPLAARVKAARWKRL